MNFLAKFYIYISIYIAQCILLKVISVKSVSHSVPLNEILVKGESLFNLLNGISLNGVSHSILLNGILVKIISQCYSL